MILPLFALFAVIICYWLFIKGYLFKLIIAGSFIFLVPAFLGAAFPASLGTAMTFGSFSISWAIFLPVIILILALLTTRSSSNEI